MLKEVENLDLEPIRTCAILLYVSPNNGPAVTGLVIYLRDWEGQFQESKLPLDGRLSDTS